MNNGKYPMAVKTGSNGNEQKYRGVLYRFSYQTETRKVTMETLSATDNYREPEKLTDPSDGDASADGKSYLRSIVGMTQADDTELQTVWENQIQNDFDNMVEKVSLAGGFYISRYEMSGSIETSGKIITESKPNQVAFTAGTEYKGDKFKWYGLYKAAKSYTHTGIVADMIWGSQYDQMLRWMAETGTNIVYGSNDMSKDNAITGATGSKDIINKVYDIYGGRNEWTLESYDTSGRAYRSGAYNFSNSPISRNVDSPLEEYTVYSSRIILCIE